MDMKAEVDQAFKDIDQKVGVALAKHDSEVIELGKASKAASDDLKALTKDHKDLHDELKKIGDAMTGIEQMNAKSGGESVIQGIGTQFVGSDAFKGFMSGNTTKATFQANTIVEGTDNTVTRHEQLPGVVPGAFRNLTIMPTVQSGTTASNVIYYSRELAWTNAAVETAENTTKPESTLTFEEVTENVRTIPHFIKVSKQALADSSFLSSYIDVRMSQGVRQRIESQIVNGAGTGVLLSGWLASGNSTVTSPLLTTDIYGLANKMKYEVIAADYTPDYFYMNPLDWSTAETVRRGTGDAAFVAASGAVSYVNNGLTPLLWGLPVVTSSAIPSGTIICKSLDADMYFSREDVRVEMFEQDDTNVQSNLVTVRAEARGAEAVMVPAAIRTGLISGITAPA
jgi:HK97 family phage major capsid protein